MDKLGNNIGYMVLKADGAILHSGGDLENDDLSARIIMDIVNLAESVDENFICTNGCERISIAYEDHVFNICMSNRLTYVFKLKTRENAASKSYFRDVEMQWT